MKQHVLKWAKSMLYGFSLTSLFVLQGTIGKTQTVAIPDANFASAIADLFPGCITGNLLDTQCSDVVNATSLDLSYKNISNLSGIEHFVSLTHLNIYQNTLVNLPPSLPSTLTYFNCADNLLQSFEGLPASIDTLECYSNIVDTIIQLPASLLYLDCRFNPFDTVYAFPTGLKVLHAEGTMADTLPLPASLEEFYASNIYYFEVFPHLPNGLKVFEARNSFVFKMPPLPNSIEYLDVSHNPLDSINTLPTSLKELRCSNSWLVTLPPTMPPGLEVLQCDFNFLTELPPLPATVNFLTATYNEIVDLPVLDTITAMIILALDNNLFTEITTLPPNLQFLSIYGDYNLSCICPLPDHLIDFQMMYTALSCIPNIPPNVYATIPLPICGTGDAVTNPNNCPTVPGIHGFAYFDDDMDCEKDPGEELGYGIKVDLIDAMGDTIASDETYFNGGYNFWDVPDGTYIVSLDTTGKTYTGQCLTNINDTTVVVSGGSSESNINFDLICKPGFDIGVLEVFPNGNFVVPGENHSLELHMGEMGNAYGLSCNSGISGQVDVVVTGDATVVGPQEWSVLTPTTHVGNTYSYTVSDFSVLDFWNSFTMIVAVDPLAVIDDSICVDVVISGTGPGDINPQNDTFHFCYPIVDGFPWMPQQPNNNMYFFNDNTAESASLQLPDNQESDESMVTLYPNPTNGLVTIQLLANQSDATTFVTLYNVTGEKVNEYTFSQSAMMNLDLSDEPSGIYFVTIQQGDEQINCKLIKQ